MPYTVENLCGLIMRSKLHSPETVRTLCQQWRQSAPDPNDAKEFARWLVLNDHLTAYQAALLLRGYADNFFLGPYKILELIGKGRMAGVYRAVHVESGQVVALKVLPPSSAHNPVLLRRFLRETEFSRQLVHPNIIRTFDAGQCRGLYYLVMEYLDGATLEEVLRERKTLTPLETARIGFFVCLALQYLYEKNLVHRDIKPADIMLVPAPQPGELIRRSAVKLLDVGLAREIFHPHKESAQAELTSAGSVVGSFDFVAPEQSRDPRKVDIRADLYSLGCVLYCCLAGQPPFPDANPTRQMARHASEPPRPLPEINPQVSGALWSIIARLLAKNPDDRYPTPNAAAEALRSVLQEQPALPAVGPSRELQAYLAWLQQHPTSQAVSSDEPGPPAQPPPPAKRTKRRRTKRPRVIKIPLSSAVPEGTTAAQPSTVPSSGASPVVAAPPGAAQVEAKPAAAQASPAVASSPAAAHPFTPPGQVPVANLVTGTEAGARHHFCGTSRSTGGTTEPVGGVLAGSPSSASDNALLTPTDLSAVSGLTLVNVEPVSPADLVRAPFGLPLPRDLVLFLAGALTVLALVAIIWLIAYFTGGT